MTDLGGPCGLRERGLGLRGVAGSHLHAALYARRFGDDRLESGPARQLDRLVGGDHGWQQARHHRLDLRIDDEVLDLGDLRHELGRRRERSEQRGDVAAALDLVEPFDDTGGLLDHERVRLGE